MIRELISGLFQEFSCIDSGDTLNDAIEIINVMKIEEQFICKGSLCGEESLIMNTHFARELASEEYLDVYLMKSVLRDLKAKQIHNVTDFTVVSHSQGYFQGKFTSISTSDLQDIKIDRLNKRLYLTTLNSLYVFDIHELGVEI